MHTFHFTLTDTWAYCTYAWEHTCTHKHTRKVQHRMEDQMNPPPQCVTILDIKLSNQAAHACKT